MRRGDILVRRGGDEFVLIMPGGNQEEARIVAGRIRQRLDDRPVEAGGGATVHQTVSIGVATWDGEEAAEELERRADAAMYEAKQQGRNLVLVAPARAPRPADG